MKIYLTKTFSIGLLALCATAQLATAGNDNIVNPASSPVRVRIYPDPSASATPQAVKPPAAANYANGQVTATTTAATLKTARTTRRSITFINTDAAITVYIGAATVTAGNGFPLKPGQSISIDTVALIQVIAASGTPVVAYFETYD